MGMICISNQRQAVLAAITYGMDNRGCNIPSWELSSSFAPVPEHWYTFIKPYYDDSKGMLYCPRARKPKEAMSAGTGAYGTATTAWFASPVIHTKTDWDHYGGFSYNNWLETDAYGLNAAILKRNNVSQPATVPVFGDGTWADNGWVLETDTIPEPEYRQDPQYAPNPGYLKRFCLDRHGDAINMAFLDGHTEARVDIDDLLNFKWHKKWNNKLIVPIVP
jgi:prepilin-type processing-associated H-X9-DG protein